MGLQLSVQVSRVHSPLARFDFAIRIDRAPKVVLGSDSPVIRRRDSTPAFLDRREALAILSRCDL
eukprot:4929122-Lingulodinium_polyedra.AAC.1